MSNPIDIPEITDVVDCSLNPKCALGALGACSSPQLMGNSAANVEASQDAGRRSAIDLPVLAPGQFDLMVIGDFPYRDDDARNMVFQDESSGLIIDYLKKAGFNLSRVWMTKITRCAPPRKRKATVSEINMCRDTHLRTEIETIMPKAVMVVGANALQAFNLKGRGSINSIRGRVFEQQFANWDDGPEFKVIPTLSTGTFFYKPNERLKARVGHDYVVAKQVVDGIEPEPHFTPKKVHVIDTPEKMDWLVEQCKRTKMFAFDTESAALSARRTPLLLVQISWGWDDVAVVPIHHHDPDAPEDQEFHVLPGFGMNEFAVVKKGFKAIFEDPEITKCAHNFKYDLNVMRWHYGLKMKGFFLDTWVQKHLMDENPPSTLEFCCELEMSWGDYSAERRKITGHGAKLRNTFDKVPDEILWPYGATDALGTYRLACIYTQRMQQDHPNLWTYYMEESQDLIGALAKAEYKGALTNMEVTDTLDKEWQGELDSLLADMRKLSWPEFNPSSNPQSIKAFKTLGVTDLELKDESAASGYSSNKKKLQEITETSKDKKIIEFSGAMLKFRNRRKMVSTYINNARADLDNDGRLRYGWVQAGPVTGRLSCRFFHQIPKIDESRVLDVGSDGKAVYVPIETRLKQKRAVMRDMFVAPEGYVYVYGDYSQVELRILAILSQDKEMLQILNSGGDLHAATAVEFLESVLPGITEATVNKFNRTEVGKRVNFGLAYGSEGHALVKTGKWMDAAGVERQFTWDMLNVGMKNWKGRFTGVGEFIDMTPDIVRMHGSIATNVFGRERHFGGQLTHKNEYERGAAEREAINFFIQSVAASITNRTIIAIDKMLESFDVSEDDVCLVNTVHDSVAYEVKEELAQWFLESMNTISQQPFPQLGNNTFKIDAGIGKSWTEAEMNA